MAFGRSKFARSSSSSTSGGSLLSKVPLWVLRFLQFVFAITVIGLYAQDLRRAHREGYSTLDLRWGYATAVGTTGAVSALVLIWPALSMWAWVWDFVVFILFTALFGLFGKMYIHYNNFTGDGDVKRMQRAVWIDLINMLLWFVTFIYGVVRFFLFRKGKSQFTGRATV
ncbi:MAG: hypothetical protein Q9184_004496 [Pyrenodesmia sp. 2 TL-2023]